MKSQVKLRDVIEHSQRERSEDQTKQKKQSNTGFVNCLQLEPLPSVYFQKMLLNNIVKPWPQTLSPKP